MIAAPPAPAEAVLVCTECRDKHSRRALHRGTGEWHTMPCACRAKLPFRFVYQPEPSGCMLAATAMMLGVTYSEVKQRVCTDWDFTKQGTHLHIVHELFEAYGYAYQTRHEFQSRLGGTRREQWPCAPWADRVLCEVRNTRDAGYHAVVLLRDGRVCDPHWGVLQGLHRFPRVVSMTAIAPLSVAAPQAWVAP